MTLRKIIIFFICFVILLVLFFFAFSKEMFYSPNSLEKEIFSAVTSTREALLKEQRISPLKLSSLDSYVVFLGISNGKYPVYAYFGSGIFLDSAILRAISVLKPHWPEGFDPKWIKVNIFAKSDLNSAEIRPETFLAKFQEGEREPLQLEQQSFFLNREKRVFFPLYRGHRIYDKISKEIVTDSINLAAQYLVNMVKDDGRFIYLYKPALGRESKQYNLLRHCGTIYAMLEVYEFNKDDKLLGPVKKAISHLKESAKPCPPPNKASYCMVEEGSTKLGGNGLAVIALAKYTKVTKDGQYLDLMKKLTQRIVDVQDKKTGDFFMHKQSYPDGKKDDFVSSYYPGEAILGLMRMYEIDKNPRWLDAAVKAARYLIMVRDNNVPVNRLEHDHWLLYGLNDVYRHHKDEIFLEHTKKIITSIMNAQKANEKFLDWNGGFYDVPRSTPAATRSEGMVAAYKLLRDFALDKVFLDQLRQTLEKTLIFQLGTQLREEKAMFFPSPERSLGGFGESLSDYNIRIDYVQHNLSALLGYLSLQL